MSLVNFSQLPPLKPFQQEACSALEKHAHVILHAATGSGKSLVFQKYLLDHPLCKAMLVVPLNALARQHHQDFKALNLPTSLGISGGDPPPSGQGVWVVNPEALQKESVKRHLQTWKPDLWIFDEAHTLWEWQNFRLTFQPTLEMVNERIQKEPKLKTFWCSATLTPKMIEALKAILNKTTHCMILGQFTFPKNLKLNSKQVMMVERLEALTQEIYNGFQCYGQTSIQIVFVSTRKMAEKVSAYLNLAGISSANYHAGYSLEEKQNLECRIKRSNHCVIVATSAFGMGMNFTQVRKVICFQPPLSLMSLAQFVGRAGRGGVSAEAVVFWDEDDFNRLSFCWKKSSEKDSSAKGHFGEDSSTQKHDLEQVFKWCKHVKNESKHLEVYFQSVNS